MEVNKEIQIVRLPTEDKTDIVYNSSLNVLIHRVINNLTDYAIHVNEYLSYQHLYLISDDEIKDGDWVLGKQNSNFKAAKQGASNFNKSKNAKKIIATTAKLLQRKKVIGRDNIGNLYNSLYLPQPSQAFIKAYIEANDIDKVLVEYEKQSYNNRFDNVDGIKNPSTWGKELQLKVNSHNEITIHPIKTSWNREEVIEKLKQFAYSGYSKEQVIGWANKNL